MGSKDETSPGMLQGTLDILILKTLSRGEMHGYDIAEHIQRYSGDVLKVEEGALYPALHRLQLKGLLSAEWGLSTNNRRAKFYRLTPLGRKHFAQESSAWLRLSGAIVRVLEASS